MKNLIPAVLVLMIFSCQGPQKKEVDLKALKDEVFELHDEVMPKMGDLRRVRKGLMLQADSIKTTDSLLAAPLIKMADELNQANEGMMIWMRNFDPDFEGTDEEVLQYLTDQKTSITEVNKNMKEALMKGEELLGSN